MASLAVALLRGAALLVALSRACACGTAGAGDDEACSTVGEFFAGVPEVRFGGPDAANQWEYKYYNADETVAGKPMKEWLKFSVAFWHSLRGDGSDPFGSATKRWPWDDPAATPMQNAEAAMRANFELMRKLGVSYWCFHDRDVAPEGATLAETNANLDAVVDLALELQKGTDIKVLWGTAQLFKHPRYMNGAATSPDVEAFAFAAAQVKKAMEATKRLGGSGYVFWGGREGYQSLLNTDMAREQDHLAVFLRMAADYKRKLGFGGTLLIEPKPQEPTKHQYDWDVATTLSFLRKHGLESDFMVNVECNHATLAGHSCQHELETARINGALGNLDANTGDPQTGWDTDEFMTDPLQATLVMASVLKNGGLPVGINFDAKLRRESTDVEDLVLAHVSAIDTLARGLRNAARLQEEGKLDELVRGRYESWDSKLGADVEAGRVGLEELERVALDSDYEKPAPSAKQELAERILSAYV